MTFSIWSPQISLISFISSSTALNSPLFISPKFTTISISSAPFFIASLHSNIFVSFVEYPFGNPITVHIFKFSFTYSFALFTYEGGMHTEATLYSMPSSQSFFISSNVHTCFKRVWSTLFNISLMSINYKILLSLSYFIYYLKKCCFLYLFYYISYSFYIIKKLYHLANYRYDKQALLNFFLEMQLFLECN